MKRTFLLLTSAVLLVACAPAGDAPVETPQIQTTKISTDTLFDEAWSEETTSAILDKTMRIRFAYDQSDLTENERAAAQQLLLAGDRLHNMYMEQDHPHALGYKTALEATPGRQDIKDIYRIAKGPILVNLEGRAENIFTSERDGTGPNVYPQNINRDAFSAFMDDNPKLKAELLHPRSVVRSATTEAKAAVLETLDARPALDALHPELRGKVEGASGYFAVPYSVAYADDIFYVRDRLRAAADIMQNEDPAFARFLRLRAVDLLTDNYDGGDATWVSADFKGKLNAQIGSYETYDDPIFGVKTYFSLSLLKREVVKSDELAKGITGIQSIEDELPYGARKTVPSRIPVGVYNVIADFGQARGTNTATILPNESHLAQQFGRTILIRSNVLMNDAIFAERRRSFNAVIAPEHHSDLTQEGGFYRTLWHEIGHSLGPDYTKSGGEVEAALQTYDSPFEEMKSDLISLFAARRPYERGAYSEAQFRSIQASGILRVLQKNRPARAQAYGTMRLIQFNWYIDQGLLTYEDGRLHIHYDKYDAAIESLLEATLDIQYEGDRDAAVAFTDKWTTWDGNFHGVIGQAMKDAETSRYRLVTYEALGE